MIVAVTVFAIVNSVFVLDNVNTVHVRFNRHESGNINTQKYYEEKKHFVNCKFHFKKQIGMYVPICMITSRASIVLLLQCQTNW